jgi:hypothetical protein
VIEEHDGMTSVVSAVEAGTGVAVAVEALGYAFGNRVKLVRLTPEPKPIVIGIAAPKRRLSPAAEKFWQCAKEVASKNSSLSTLDKCEQVSVDRVRLGRAHSVRLLLLGYGEIFSHEQISSDAIAIGVGRLSIIRLVPPSKPMRIVLTQLPAFCRAAL